MKVTLRFLWFDGWVGVFVDRPKRTVYVCPLPCVVVKIEPKPTDPRADPDWYDTHCPTCDAPEPTHTPTCAVVHRSTDLDGSIDS